MKRIASALAALLLALSAGPAYAHHTPWDATQGTYIIVWESSNKNGDHWLRYKNEGNVPALKDHDEYLFLWCAYNAGEDEPEGWNNCISSFDMRLGKDWCFRAYNRANYIEPLFTLKAIGQSTMYSESNMGSDDDDWSSYRWAPFDYDSGTCLF